MAMPTFNASLYYQLNCILSEVRTQFPPLWDCQQNLSAGPDATHSERNDLGESI